MGDAPLVAELLRVAAGSAPGEPAVTLSAGVATVSPAAPDASALIAASDEALYASKRAGRDRLTVACDATVEAQVRRSR